ncbi:sterol desaturase family protein [Algimonas porphyrae]|uniref:Beta-carotene hydroxylase n=1 Tax=Algimonas porphyrae TaxID=1128113 RepID=A0ABQ5UW06_9PROT|nr:sterol desaturase family protein [Algimonas porphyrae]GLQ19074.1 beta-carotene hydroxylase [Algimonas porphyrae]
MTLWAALTIVLLSIILMEIFAWAIHKYVMHGIGWGWHESHHRETDGPFETNDLYAVCFSVIAAALFIAGSLWWDPAWFIALGLTIYGLLYAFVHDGLVHQRWPFFVKARGRYMKRLVQAHRLHHAVHTRDGAVSFGFLWAEDVRRLKARLKAQNPVLK